MKKMGNKSVRTKVAIIFALLLSIFISTKAQVPVSDTTSATITDTVIVPESTDTILRIKNLNPFFTLHVDSTLQYNLEINKAESDYYWFLRNSPVGLRINKDNGLLTLKVEKSFFLSGKLKYDQEYPVQVGVQNLNNPAERIDTFFRILFYNTDIMPSRVKPSVNSTLVVEEGDTVSFKVQCENGSFPIEHITFFANTPLKNYLPIAKCNDDFLWSPTFDFVKETDSGKVKVLTLNFVGANRFMIRDTATVRIIVKDALNYPLAVQEYQLAPRSVDRPQTIWAGG